MSKLTERLAKDVALLNAYHEWEMPAPPPAEPLNYASIADRIEEADALITSLREALDGVLAEADRDTQAFRRAREALREQS